jgi:cytochrome c1
MNAQDTYPESHEKNRVILDATEKIETVMEIDPVLQSYSQQISQVEAPTGQSMGFMVLWFLVLFVQVMMFWQQKRKE